MNPELRPDYAGGSIVNLAASIATALGAVVAGYSYFFFGAACFAPFLLRGGSGAALAGNTLPVGDRQRITAHPPMSRTSST